MNDMRTDSSTQFSHYQKWAAGLLAFLQFAVILDFMIISALGAMIMNIPAR